MKQLLLDIQPPALPSLQNFVSGRNAEALHSLQQAISSIGAEPPFHIASTSDRFIYLWGEPGSGKSHLLQACASMAAAKLVCVDDVHLLSDEQQIALFNRYNQLRDNGGALIASGTAAPRHMGLRDDLATRLAWGLSYQLHALSDEEKAMAMHHHAQRRGMKLPAEVLDYCLRHLQRDMPTLIATLDALDDWSLSYKRPVTLPLLRQLLQSVQPKPDGSSTL